MKILLVDDESYARVLFAQRFRKEIASNELQFTFAGSGNDALGYLREQQQDIKIVLSDINMPGMSGLELLEKIKQKPDKPAPFVMMISAYGDEENLNRSVKLSECFLIDMDELENLSKKSIGDLKSLMKRREIRTRRPYSRVSENLPRRASFIGSTNHTEFLKDDTGSRRFLCFEIEVIDNDNEINIDLAFSQALVLYNSGFQYWFNKEEEQEIQINNEQFHSSSSEADLLLRHFQLASPHDEGVQFMTASSIAQELNLPVNQTTLQRLGRTLSGRRFINVSRENRKMWAVRSINND